MNAQSVFAEVLVDELVRLGVREVVLAPGSRSAPLAYALHAADAAGRLRLHVRVDERSAAFLAVGLAKATGMPAPVVTTSGTAVANLMPAVLEAHESGVPMLLLTADRPPELRGTRANQTTDQSGFFGSFVRWFHDLGVPEARIGAAAAWRTSLDRAVAAATGGTGADAGPVHLNLPLRDPLAPGGGDAWPESVAGRADGGPWTRVSRSRRAPGIDPVNGADSSAGPGLPHESRTLVVLGDARSTLLQAGVEWAGRRGHPVIGEPFGRLGDPADRLPHGVRLAPRAEEPGLQPDRVVVIGRLTLSRSLARLLRLPGVRVDLVTDDHRWPDPGHVVHAVHDPGVLHDPPAEPSDGSGAHADRPGPGDAHAPSDSHAPSDPPAPSDSHAPSDPHVSVDPDRTREPHGRPEPEAQEFRQAWMRASEEAGEAVRADLVWPDGPSVAAAVLAALPADALLFVGSSNGVRHLDLVRGARVDTAEVVASRGLAGIDGCVSTAAGLALGSGRPTYAFVGDLTFLHDANGLLIGPGEPRVDLTIVVANDDGGAIFGDLEYGRPEQREAYPGVLERVFRTPTGTDLGALCRAHGVGHVLATTPDEVSAALETAPRGITVVEVPVTARPPQG